LNGSSFMVSWYRYSLFRSEKNITENICYKKDPLAYALRVLSNDYSPLVWITCACLPDVS
jgi:hypothetical protein